MKRRISVIIPVYNGARFIREALESVCDQTYLPVEIVVADDCSTDDTREVVAEFATTTPVPITLFTMEKNTGGPYGPASEAFRRTTGAYVTVLDADDMFTPDAFATYVAMFDADPTANVGVAISDLLMFEDGTGRVVMPSLFDRCPLLRSALQARPSVTGVLLDRQLAIRTFATEFSIPFRGLIARPVWEALGGPDLRLRHACDVDFTWRLLSRTDYRVRILDRALNQVRQWGGSMSSNQVLANQELVVVYRTMLNDLSDPDLRKAVRGHLRKGLFDLAYCSRKKKLCRTFASAAYGLAVERVREAVRCRP